MLLDSSVSCIVIGTRVFGAKMFMDLVVLVLYVNLIEVFCEIICLVFVLISTPKALVIELWKC